MRPPLPPVSDRGRYRGPGSCRPRFSYRRVRAYPVRAPYEVACGLRPLAAGSGECRAACPVSRWWAVAV